MVAIPLVTAYEPGSRVTLSARHLHPVHDHRHGVAPGRAEIQVLGSLGELEDVALLAHVEVLVHGLAADLVRRRHLVRVLVGHLGDVDVGDRGPLQRVGEHRVGEERLVRGLVFAEGQGGLGLAGGQRVEVALDGVGCLGVGCAGAVVPPPPPPLALGSEPLPSSATTPTMTRMSATTAAPTMIATLGRPDFFGGWPGPPGPAGLTGTAGLTVERLVAGRHGGGGCIRASGSAGDRAVPGGSVTGRGSLGGRRSGLPYGCCP